MARTIIVSNRLPVKVQRNKENIIIKPSSGGLATGLGSIYKKRNNLWIGWAGLHIETEAEKKNITEQLSEENLHPIFLTEEEIIEFYEGFSNATLWPTFHYFTQYSVYLEQYWSMYQKVNQKFCDEIIALAQPDDTIWVHDYQLLLLPRMLREKLPKSSIGFFQHIPFPSYEVFRMLPWRRELLLGMLGSDLVGFHTYDDMRHFLSSVNRLAGIGYLQGQVEVDNRKVQVDAFPMGIDYDKYAQAAASPQTIEREVRFRRSLGDEKLILSIDRLDYSKGIPQRLLAFERFFEKNPQYLGKVSLILIVVPSRDNVEEYARLKVEIDTLVGKVNGRYGRIDWTPIHYFYRSFPLESLSAFYRMAHVALVTPLRDGMNLVCKEFIASKLGKKGVLILSEMAGAAKELSDAILINPNDINAITDAIYQALTMPDEEQILHIDVMQNSLKRYNIHHWVNLFIERLKDIKAIQQTFATKDLEVETANFIREKYKNTKQRLIFLDYDGTLMPFTKDPKKAVPDAELKDIITKLIEDSHNRVIIISGRDKTTLGGWMKDFDVDIIAEHGVWFKEKEKDWVMADNLSAVWKEEIRPVLELYVNRTPGSFIEEKNYSLVWHYRKVETGLGELRTRELSSHLKYLTTNMNLQVLEGDMVLEIKSTLVNKGKGAEKWLKKFSQDFIIAIGDDRTDEDTFKVMPPEAFTIKVGHVTSKAKFFIKSPKEVRALLKSLIDA